MRKLIDLDENLKVLVEESRREDDIARLAVELAEAYEDAANFQGDAEAFQAQALDDRAKAQEFQRIIRRINAAGGDRSKIATINPKTGLPRRMDPMREMDLGALTAEVEMRRKRSNDFRDKANEAKNKAVAARRRAQELRDEIKKARERIAREDSEIRSRLPRRFHHKLH